MTVWWFGSHTSSIQPWTQCPRCSNSWWSWKTVRRHAKCEPHYLVSKVIQWTLWGLTIIWNLKVARKSQWLLSPYAKLLELEHSDLLRKLHLRPFFCNTTETPLGKQWQRTAASRVQLTMTKKNTHHYRPFHPSPVEVGEVTAIMTMKDRTYSLRRLVGFDLLESMDGC